MPRAYADTFATGITGKTEITTIRRRRPPRGTRQAADVARDAITG